MLSGNEAGPQHRMSLMEQLPGFFKIPKRNVICDNVLHGIEILFASRLYEGCQHSRLYRRGGKDCFNACCLGQAFNNLWVDLA